MKRKTNWKKLAAKLKAGAPMYAPKERTNPKKKSPNAAMGKDTKFKFRS